MYISYCKWSKQFAMEIRTSCHWLVKCLVKVQANNKPSAKPTVAYMYKSHSTVIQCILGLLRVSQHPIYHIRKSQLSLSNRKCYFVAISPGCLTKAACSELTCTYTSLCALAYKSKKERKATRQRVYIKSMNIHQ